MRLHNSKWNTLLGLLFMGFIALALLGRLLCTRSYMDYEKLRRESYIPDVIETVLWVEDMNQLYVCYNTPTASTSMMGREPSCGPWARPGCAIPSSNF